MNEKMTCENCGGTQFLLYEDRRIICASYGCGTVFGSWVEDDTFAVVVQVPPLFGSRGRS